MINQQTTNKYTSYFDKYIDLVEEKDVLKAIKNSAKILKKILKKIDEEKANYSYQQGKWTIKELLVHLLDTERVFTYRILAISRGEQTELPGFDEDNYALFSNATNRSFKSIKKELWVVRKSTVLLFKSLTSEMLEKKGIAGGNELNPTKIGFILVGHQAHHFNVLKSKYLLN